MDDWNLYILFGVGGGLFSFFSTCFCYYKRKDVIRRREEKLFEEERDEYLASTFTKSSTPHTEATSDTRSNSNPISSANSNGDITSPNVVVIPLTSSSSASLSSHRRTLSSSSNSKKKVKQNESSSSKNSYINAAFQTTHL